MNPVYPVLCSGVALSPRPEEVDEAGEAYEEHAEAGEEEEGDQGGGDHSLILLSASRRFLQPPHSASLVPAAASMARAMG